MAHVTTTAGALSGATEDGLHVFRGIPYAAPPVGELRWRAPQPVQPWSGDRDATAFGPAAHQAPTPVDSPSSFAGMFGAGELELSEDCLTLNVWTPGLDGSRPVMVWIHGGGFRTGTGASPMYDGARLANRGDVVVVTINYRLGAFGYLYIEGLDANVGSRDQVAALEWVRDEIAAFGGDPGSVTIFGESGGARSVEMLLAMPSAAGLYHRAILQSTSHLPLAPGVATRVAGQLLGQLDASPDPAELRAIPGDRVIGAQTALEEAAAAGGPPALRTNPVIDGDSLLEQPLDLIARGGVAAVPMLIGTNLDEMKLFSMLNPAMGEVDDDNLFARLAMQLRDEAARTRAIETYRAAREGRGADTSAAELMSAIASDAMFRAHSTRVAAAQSAHQPDTYMYLFNFQAREAGFGACHAIDLPFVFGTFDTPLGQIAGDVPEAHALSERMQDAWIAFARTGAPNHEGLPEWPRYDATDRATMVLDEQCAVERAPLEAEREFWESIR